MKFAGKAKASLNLLATAILGLGLLTACGNKEATAAQVQTTQTEAKQTNTNTNNNNQETNMSDIEKMSQFAVFILNDLKTSLNLTNDELKAFVESANKYLETNTTLSDKDRDDLQQYLNARAQKIHLASMAKEAEVNGKAGKEFIEKFKKENTNTVKDDSGIVYIIENQGKGEQIKKTDTVKVKYKGSLVDGKVFDQNDSGVDFPLDRVIPGFTLAITKLNVGGKIKVVIPPELAYGEQGIPNAIPPRSTLVFEIEVVSVTPAKAQTK